MTDGDIFATTRWTQVVAAQGASTQAGTALAELCAAYYAPVHSYIARTAQDLGDARDLTQEFFARLLAGRVIAGAEREKGRFRAYLLGAVKHYLADTRDRRRAAKRGAQHDHVPLVSGTDTSPGHECAVPESPAPDAFFDRQWGLAVLDLALTALAAEHDRQGKAGQFQLLKPWLTGDAAGASQAEVAAQLGLSDGAVKVAIHRLRKRFRDLVKAEIAHTVSTEEEAREELRYFIEVVSRSDDPPQAE
ncbi:MAG: sigma-70 family RNA polymerase sigma factor [Chthoniobacter sp.]|uniref:RNA polymerase sigma factor n=1 Tax=Chthoniobacter sp. TaxID=2510640 RepID=UPI0032AC8135